jgi:hypothetical protein
LHKPIAKGFNKATVFCKAPTCANRLQGYRLHKRTNLLVTLCVRCHIRIHHSSGWKYWFSEMLMGLWRELHPNVPMQFQLTFENNEKKGNSKCYLEEASGKVPPLFGSARCPARN